MLEIRKRRPLAEPNPTQQTGGSDRPRTFNMPRQQPVPIELGGANDIALPVKPSLEMITAGMKAGAETAEQAWGIFQAMVAAHTGTSAS